MTNYFCVPLYLFPDSSIGFTRCEVVAGVRIQRISKPLIAFVRQRNEVIPPGSHPGFFPSHLIMIETQRHFDYLTELLAREGREFPEHPHEQLFGRPQLFIEPYSVIRHVVLALFLTGGLTFRVGGFHAVDVSTIGKKTKYVAGSYSHHDTEGSYLQNAFCHFDTTAVVDSRSLKKTAKHLQRYYRSYSWWNDRFGMALGYLWNVLCTPNLDQGFVGLAMALEAALSTGRDEITHQLAERVAILLEEDPGKRLETYKLVKKLYRTRSSLVHGGARVRKGRLTSESLAVTAKHIFVPLSQGKSFMQLVVAVLNALLEDHSYLDIVQNIRNEETVDRRIDELFTRRVLGHAD